MRDPRCPHLFVTQLFIQLVELAVVLVHCFLARDDVFQSTGELVTHSVYFALAPDHLVLVMLVVLVVMVVMVRVQCTG
jgi:hypothetical protein